MQPIHELLNRIRWDADFGKADFKLGYWDRVTREIIIIPLSGMDYEHPTDDAFQMVDEAGNSVSIPFHRVRQVFRNGQLIWNRDG